MNTCDTGTLMLRRRTNVFVINARPRRSFRCGTSAGGAATLTSIAATYCQTPRGPSLARRTCTRSRAIPVLSEESEKHTAILGKWLLFLPIITRFPYTRHSTSKNKITIIKSELHFTTKIRISSRVIFNKIFITTEGFVYQKGILIGRIDGPDIRGELHRRVIRRPQVQLLSVRLLPIDYAVFAPAGLVRYM